MTYNAPVAEQRFVLDVVTGIRDLGVDSDIVDAILEGAGAFATGEFAPLNRIGDTQGARWADGRVTMPAGYRDAYRAYVDGGWGSLDGPEHAGGQGLPFALATVVLEDLGASNMAFTLCPMLTVGAIEAIHTHGNDAQRSIYLPKLVSGEWTGTMNLTESQAGSDVGALRSTATPAADGSWRITGTKIFITFGEHDLTDNIVHLVLARTPDAPAGTKGISLFLVPKLRPDVEGEFTLPNDVRCVSIEHKLGINASPTCVMSYGDNGDCHGWLIGPEMGGMRAMFTMMNNARLNVGLQGVQIGERATQAAIAYARDRVQGGRAIIDYPDVRRMLMRMQALTQGARSLLYAAAGDVDRAKAGVEGAKARLDVLTPLAKAWGTDVGCEVASLGVQIHGGMGFIEEAGAAQHYRDIRIAPIYEGTNGIQAADLVGRKLTGDGGTAVRALIAATRADATASPTLCALCDRVSAVTDWMLSASPDDRLAGSYPYLEMLAVAVAGGLMMRQAAVAAAMIEKHEDDPAFLTKKISMAHFFADQIAAEAIGKAAAATAGNAALDAVAAL